MAAGGGAALIGAAQASPPAARQASPPTRLEQAPALRAMVGADGEALLSNNARPGGVATDPTPEAAMGGNALLRMSFPFGLENGWKARFLRLAVVGPAKLDLPPGLGLDVQSGRKFIQ